MKTFINTFEKYQIEWLKAMENADARLMEDLTSDFFKFVEQWRQEMSEEKQAFHDRLMGIK